jgi:hypothetical protein
MGDKEIKKTGLANRFMLWLAKSILFGVVGVFLLGLIVYALRQLHAPLMDALVNAGIGRSLSDKILVTVAVVFWVMLIGNIIMYFRGVKR